MSQIYLTKIERKTIFTKSLIFVLIMFIISDLTVTGPFYFNFIPWLYVLGLLGSVKNIDSVLIGVIGVFTVGVSSVIQTGGFNTASLLEIILACILIVFGILTGKIIYEFILEHRLVKYIKPSKKIIYIALMTVMVILSFISIGYLKGDFISFLMSRNRLDEYIESSYSSEYDIKRVRFNKNVAGRYVYVVEMENEEITFVPVTNKTFKDVDLDKRLDEINKKLNEEMAVKVNNLLNSKYTNLKSLKTEYVMQYTKVSVHPDKATLYINFNNDKLENKLLAELVDCIKEIYNLKEVNNTLLTINNINIELDEEKIRNLNIEYIKGGLVVDNLEENT